MAIRTELKLSLQNNPGTLARMCQVLADEHVNIVAIDITQGFVVRMVVDNPVHGAAVLRERHYQVDEREVLYTTTPNDPGALGRFARLIAEAGINIEYLYATASEEADMAAVIVGVPDVRRAAAAAGV
jgi:hypothetical protein